jgi:hypothetical protein
MVEVAQCGSSYNVFIHKYHKHILSWRMDWAEHGRGEKSEQGFGGKVHGR